MSAEIFKLSDAAFCLATPIGGFLVHSSECCHFVVVDNPDLQKSLAVCIMRLNRAAVLDYPQLGVPWFHEDFALKMAQNGGCFCRSLV